MAAGLVDLDLAAYARRRGAFTDLLRRVDGMPPKVELRATPNVVSMPSVAQVELSTGSGKTTSLMLIPHLARANRQALILAPAVIETMHVARRLQILATTSMLSHGVDVVDGEYPQHVLVLPRTTGEPNPASGYARLRRVAPELFAVACRRPQVPWVGVSDERLHRRIRRLLARLNVRTCSLADVLAAAARRVLRDGQAQVDRAASTCGHTSPNTPLSVPVRARPQLTRGPTASWTNSVLSVHGEPAYA